MQKPPKSIKQLYSHLSEDECRIAEENIAAYLGLVLRIYRRLELERNEELLTDQKSSPTMQAKVDSLNNLNTNEKL